MKLTDLINEDKPCWKGYKQIGMKDKDGKKVPNCVPESYDVYSESEGYTITFTEPITEAEYQEYLNAPDYLCNYYQKSIWKESEREYGKNQYRYSKENLEKIKILKEEGKALCDAGKLKEGEAKLIEAITIISFTMMK